MEEMKLRIMLARGTTNAMRIVQSLITEDCPMQHRLRMIDLMCHLDGVIWI